MGELYHLNVGCADASMIITDAAFVVDCHRIDEYAHLLPKSKHLRGVVVTHQHRDHYSGLEFLRKEGYTIDCLIYSPYSRRYGDASVTIEEWNEFAELRDYFENNGTKLYAPFRQASWNKPYWETNGVKFWVLGPKEGTAEADSRELHDACLVVKAHLGSRRCLFTGDASDRNLQDVASLNRICDDILNASHHGSIEGADLGFIKKCAAGYTVISTEAGVHDNVPHPTALKRYRENTKNKVYRTDQDGTLKWTF
jgi:beta-lactamase superfamily II metal-dependent hydrolase